MTGNLGIGDTASATLHVFETDTANATARFRNTNTALKTSAIQLEDYSGAIVDYYFGNCNSSSSAASSYAFISNDIVVKQFKFHNNGQLEVVLADGTAPLILTSTTKVSNMNADRVDDIHLQVSGGILQYDSGAGWTSVAVQPNTQEFSDLEQAVATDDTWYTVCDASGAGVLSRVTAYCPGHNNTIEVKITIDGTARTWDLTAVNDAVTPANAITDLYSHQFSAAKFDTTLKVEVRQTSGGDAILHAVVDFGLV
jgi:hypothetical protein